MSRNAYQNKRKLDRKIKLVKLHGGECRDCGYKKSLAALTFHHIDPKKKSFKVSGRHLSNKKWESLTAEADKCELLCSNCHMERHYPDEKKW